MHIGYAMQDPASDYWQMVSAGVHERAAEQGITLTTTYATTLAQQNAALQTLIEQAVDAILLAPIVSSGLGAMIALARAQSIPVILLGVQISDGPVECTLQSDHHHGAELAAGYVVAQLGGQGAVAHIMGPSRQQDNVERAEGVRHIFSQQPGITLAFEQESPDWSSESGAMLMQAALAAVPNLRAVCVANDTLALGALDAISTAGLTGQILVTGFDASPEAVLALENGHLAATVRQSVHTLGRTAVDLAQQVLSGATLPAIVLQPVELVTRANLPLTT